MWEEKLILKALAERKKGRPLMLGTNVNPWGKIGMVGVTGGERYYWLTDDRGMVSMIPADMVENAAREVKYAQIP